MMNACRGLGIDHRDFVATPKSIAGWEDNREDSSRKGQKLTCERSKKAHV
jgi:hypothetical protein